MDIKQKTAYTRKWRQEHSEKWKEYCRRWKKANPEKVRKYRKQYNQFHSEYNRLYRKHYNYIHRKERLAYLATGPGKEKAEHWKKTHREQCLKKKRQWEKNNPEKVREYHRKTYQKNPEKSLVRHRIWRLKNFDYVREYRRCVHRRYYQTKEGMLNTRISVLIWKALRKNKAGRSWKTLVDFTLEELKNHLESQFEDGMDWERFMKGEIHIDHKIPKSRFKYKKPEDAEFRACWSLSNLQPLWVHDNLSKHSKTMIEWQQWKQAV